MQIISQCSECGPAKSKVQAGWLAGWLAAGHEIGEG